MQRRTFIATAVAACVLASGAAQAESYRAEYRLFDYAGHRFPMGAGW